MFTRAPRWGSIQMSVERKRVSCRHYIWTCREKGRKASRSDGEEERKSKVCWKRGQERVVDAYRRQSEKEAAERKLKIDEGEDGWSKRWESWKRGDKVRRGFDIITVSRACVYRSAPVYWGSHTERTPGELSTHTYAHMHREQMSKCCSPWYWTQHKGAQCGAEWDRPPCLLSVRRCSCQRGRTRGEGPVERGSLYLTALLIVY